MSVAWSAPINVPGSPTGFNFQQAVWAPALSEWWACGKAGSSSTTNNLYKSSDGVNWFNVDPGFQKGYNAITWSPDLSMLCTLSGLSSTGGTSTHVITTSIDGGASWQEHDIPDGSGFTASNASQFVSVCWAGGSIQKFVAVAQNVTNAHQVMTSSDGVNWFNQTAAAARTWNSVIWVSALSDILIAVGSKNSVNDNVMTSADGGSTWLSHTTPVNVTFAQLHTLGYGNGYLTAFGHVNNGATSADRCHLFTSPNGTTWTASTDAGLLLNHGWENAVWDNVEWVAISQQAGPSPDFARSMTAPDPTTTWTQIPDPVNAIAWNYIAHSPNLSQVLAIEQGGNRIMAGAVTWVPKVYNEDLPTLAASAVFDPATAPMTMYSETSMVASPAFAAAGAGGPGSLGVSIVSPGPSTVGGDGGLNPDSGTWWGLDRFDIKPRSEEHK